MSSTDQRSCSSARSCPSSLPAAAARRPRRRLRRRSASARRSARRRGSSALVALVTAGAVLADGDPASDALIVQNVFFPYPAPPASATGALSTQVEKAYTRGYRVKVAVVASETDLGSVPSLFNKPQDYAKFLGEELQFYYVGPLLVVMPAGYGIYDGGRSVAAEDAVLAKLKVSGS